MTVGALRYAEGVKDDDGRFPPIPKELLDLGYIDRFGVRAVTGKDVLPYGYILAMTVAENIVHAYISRKRSENWAKWAQDNPREDALLKRVEILANATD